MKKNVVVKQLFIYVASGDQSYMPQELMVLGGKKHKLKEIKDVKIPSTVNGAVLLVENLKVYYPSECILQLQCAHYSYRIYVLFILCCKTIYKFVQ